MEPDVGDPRRRGIQHGTEIAAGPPPPVGRAARLLGYAGLLPQAAALILFQASFLPDPYRDGDGLIVAWAMVLVAYPLLILSFIGGIWWGLALRAQRPARFLMISTVPSLVALAMPVAFILPGIGWLQHGLPIATGLALYATLFMDRRLVRDGLAPANWMRLRVPLSLGLGTLTILPAVLF